MESLIENLKYRLMCVENKLLKLENEFKLDVLLGIPSKNIYAKIAALRTEKRMIQKLYYQVKKDKPIEERRT